MRLRIAIISLFALAIGLTLLILGLMANALAAQPDSVKEIKKNATGWSQFRYYEDGVLTETIWGYQKKNGKWKLVKKTGETYAAEDNAKKPKKEKKK